MRHSPDKFAQRMLIAGGGIPYRFILNYKQIDARTPLLQYGSPWIEAMSQVSSGALASCGRRGAATCLSKKSAHSMRAKSSEEVRSQPTLSNSLDDSCFVAFSGLLAAVIVLVNSRFYAVREEWCCISMACDIYARRCWPGFKHWQRIQYIYDIRG